MLEISWSAKKSNKTVSQEAQTIRTAMKSIRKVKATFLDHVMSREKVEHLARTGVNKGKCSRGRQPEKKRSRGKQREKMLAGLSK